MIIGYLDPWGWRPNEAEARPCYRAMEGAEGPRRCTKIRVSRV